MTEDLHKLELQRENQELVRNIAKANYLESKGQLQKAEHNANVLLEDIAKRPFRYIKPVDSFFKDIFFKDVDKGTVVDVFLKIITYPLEFISCVAIFPIFAITSVLSFVAFPFVKLVSLFYKTKTKKLTDKLEQEENKFDEINNNVELAKKIDQKYEKKKKLEEEAKKRKIEKDKKDLPPKTPEFDKDGKKIEERTM